METVTATLSDVSYFTTAWMIAVSLIDLCIVGVLVYLCILLIKALRKYLRSEPIRKENAAVRRSLGEALKEHRVQCQMTQEFVAEHLGVSRQAVSKWENGTSDPSTSNLLSLAKLYGIDATDLLRQVNPDA